MGGPQLLLAQPWLLLAEASLVEGFRLSRSNLILDAEFGCCSSPHLMTPAAVGNQDTTAAVFNGMGRIYMVSATPNGAETGLEPPPPTGPSVWGKLAGLVKSVGGHFTEKQRLRQAG